MTKLIGMVRSKNILAGIIVVFIIFPIAKYISLHSNVMDLGVFEHQIVILTQGEWQASLAGHLHGYSLVLASIMSRYVGADFPVGIVLVGIQSLLVILPTFIFSRIAGIWVALAYIAYSPVWINAHFDFHYDHLAIPLLMGFYLALGNGRFWLAFLSAGLLVFIKEPFALQTAACGLLMVFMAIRNTSAPFRNRLWLAGAALIVAGGGYFYFAVRFALPYFAPATWDVFTENVAFAWLGNGLGEVTGNIITHPLAILKEILTTPGKLIYLFIVFGLLAFIPLLAPSYLIPALPLLGITMLSHLPNHYDYNTHYTAGLIIPVMFAFIHGLPTAHALWIKVGKWILRKVFIPRFNKPFITQGGKGISMLEERLSKSFYVLLALWILGGHMMTSPSPISRLFWSEKVWSYSWQAYVPTERETMMKEAMLTVIPSDLSVSVTAQNTINWFHLAHRKIFAPFPMGATEPIAVMDWSNRTWEGFWNFVNTGKMPPSIIHNRYSDYVVLDLKRPWFIIDKGCDWLYGACRNDDVAAKFLRLVDETRQSYDTVFERDGFMILRRKK